MNSSANKITYLDQTRLARAITAGIREVISHQDYLNKINVFPVPDGDTGTNMALTMNAILDGTYNRPTAHIHDYLDLVADCALNGARGNSGTIIAQFFLGFSEGAKTVDQKFTTKNFVAAVSTASNIAHKALSEPKEGTILTVIRDFANEITQQQLANDHHDFTTLLEAGLMAAERSLKNTTYQLKELKKANVVDAGAQGFVNFIQGICNFIQYGSVANLEKPIAVQNNVIATHNHQDIDEKFRYCTECIIKGDHLKIHEIRQSLEQLGNCVIVAGSEKIAKIHIHTNDPSIIFELAKQHGDVQREKADDMIKQQHTVLHIDQKVAILTDSTADFPINDIAKYNIHVVPLSIKIDNRVYLDKVSITTQEFYEMLPHTEIFPQTSQPSLGDFKRQYQFLASHYPSVIAIHLPQGVSGTLNASKTASNSIDSKITIVDSLNVSAGLGLVTSLAAKAASKGFSHETILSLIDTATKKTHLYCILNQLDYAIKGGRVPKHLKTICDLLSIRPVITFNHRGRSKVAHVVRLKNNLPEKMLALLKKKLKKNIQYNLAIVHMNSLDKAEQAKSLVEDHFDNLLSVNIMQCAAAIGAHVGPGSLGVAFQEHIDLDEFLTSQPQANA